MTTILFVLSAIVLDFYVIGAVALIWENKFTEYFEFFVEFNGWFITALGAFNSLLLVLAITIGAIGSTQVLILLAYILFCIGSIAVSTHKFIRA